MDREVREQADRDPATVRTVKRQARKIRGKSSDRSTIVLRDEKGWNCKASQSTKTRSLLATTTHDSEQDAGAAPEAMRFVQNNSLREIVEDAPSICERHSQRNDVGDRMRDSCRRNFSRVRQAMGCCHRSVTA